MRTWTLVFTLVYAILGTSTAYSTTETSAAQKLDFALQALRTQEKLPELKVSPKDDIVPSSEALPDDVVNIFNRIQQFVFGRSNLISLKGCDGCQALADAHSMVVYLDHKFVASLRKEFKADAARIISFIVAHEIGHFAYEYMAILSKGGSSPNGHIPLMTKTFPDFVDLGQFSRLNPAAQQIEIDKYMEKAGPAHAEVDLLGLVILKRLGVDAAAEAKKWISLEISRRSKSELMQTDFEIRLKTLDEAFPSRNPASKTGSKSLLSVTVESASSARKNASQAFQELLEDFASADGKAIPLRLRMNPAFADKLGDADKLIFDGHALLIAKFPTATSAEARSVFLQDNSLLSKLRSVQEDGLPIILLPADRGVRGFVLPPSSELTKSLLSGIQAILPELGDNGRSSIFGISPQMTADVFIHEAKHLNDFSDGSDVNQIMNKLETVRTLKGNERTKYFNFIREYFAYVVQLEYLRQIKADGEAAYGYFPDELPHVRKVSPEKLYEQKVKQIQDSASYHGWRLSPALQDLKAQVGQYCQVVGILAAALADPALPLSTLLGDSYDLSKCQDSP